MTASAAKKDQTSTSASKAWLRALEMTASIDAAPTRTLPVVIGELGARFGGRPALIGRETTFSHALLAARMYRYANWALDQGIGKGDGVALLLPNSPDYMAAWLGLTGIGAVAALLNTHLRGAGLAHAIGAAAPKHLIVAPELAGPVADPGARADPAHGRPAAGVRGEAQQSRGDLRRVGAPARLGHRSRAPLLDQVLPERLRGRGPRHGRLVRRQKAFRRLLVSCV